MLITILQNGVASTSSALADPHMNEVGICTSFTFAQKYENIWIQ